MTDDVAYTITVVGTGYSYSFGATLRAFDETYALRAEHPAPALVALTQEIEWGLLDPDRAITITIRPVES